MACGIIKISLLFQCKGVLERVWLHDFDRNVLPTAVFYPYVGFRFCNSVVSSDDVVRPPQKGSMFVSQWRIITVDEGVQVAPSNPSLSYPKCPPWRVGGVNP